MVILICLFVYLIPISIICWYMYTDMRKGETIEEYYNRAHLDDITIFMVLFPIVNIAVSFIVLKELIWSKIKDLKK